MPGESRPSVASQQTKVAPTGDITIEDEDEVAEATREGLLSVDQLDAIERAVRTVSRDPRRIVREALRLVPEAR
jgi:predicted RNA-binding protein associated with RNAse of E/G family